MKNGFIKLILVLVILGAMVAIAFLYISKNKQKTTNYANNYSNYSNSDNSQDKTKGLLKNLMDKQKNSFKIVSKPKLLFTGGYADPTIAQKDNTLIMYLNNFSVQPSTYEAHTSTDGLTWKKAKTKLPNASTGRAVKFDEKIRLYYPDVTPIRPTDPPASILSAISNDGFSFTKESGTRVDPQKGYYLEGPTVFQLKDGTYRMYFSENDLASAEKRISSIWGATSTNGLTWTRDKKPTLEATVAEEGIPADWPQALHPFVLTRPSGDYFMFYNTHSQVYAAESSDGLNWTKLGQVGIHGADVDGYYLPNGDIRLYYGDFSPETLGVVYTIDIRLE